MSESFNVKIASDSMEAQMLRGFELERQQCKRLLKSRSPKDVIRGRERLAIIESSVAQIQRVQKGGLNGNIFGGYDQQDLARYEATGKGESYGSEQFNPE